MSNLHAKNPFSAWGYGERHRCDHCGQYEGNRPAHKPNCEWSKNDLARRKTAARRLLGLTKKDVADLSRILKKVTGGE